MRPAVATAEVSWTSRTTGVTGAVGTFDARTASAVYAAVRAVGVRPHRGAVGPDGGGPDHVEGDQTGRRREHSEHHGQGQQLLTGRDEARARGGHSGYSSAGEESHG